MTSCLSDPEQTPVAFRLAFESYRTGTVRLIERNLTGMTHLVTSRGGLWAVNEHEHRMIAHGFFFGMSWMQGNLYVFESCDLPRGPTRMGRLVKLEVRDGQILEARVLARGLDNGCHQIDWIDGRLHVVDTYNQQILRFDHHWKHEVLSPLASRPAGGWADQDHDYRHVNSLLAVGDRILLLLHNGGPHQGRESEIALFDKDWRELERWPLRGTGCHGMALLENGSLLTCGSLEGTVFSANGFLMRTVSPYMTRGLSIGSDSIVVGASKQADRMGRLTNPGTVTFMDRQFRVSSVLDVPGAPMEIRRLDGQDAGLSMFLSGQPWGSSMKQPAREPADAWADT